MGKNNKQRRAAKRRNRARRQHRPSGPRPRPRPHPRTQAATVPDPRDLVVAAVAAHTGGDGRVFDAAVDQLLAHAPESVATVLQPLLEHEVARAWDRSWQPADVERVARRELDTVAVEIVVASIAADAERYRDLGDRVARAWMNQLDTIDAEDWWSPGRPYLVQLDAGWERVLRAALRLLAVLRMLPELSRIGPPPSEWRDGMTTDVAAGAPPELLAKVRALLAKAESTTFDAEAEALTAKAQQLMTRHRIDRATVTATDGSTRDGPAARRIEVDDPYAEAKALLLGVVADANGARAVWHKGFGFSEVIGFGDELDVVEELFTSLLVQATAAMRRQGSKRDGAGRSRTTRFRRSFLVAFAHRIGERLREAVDASVAEAEHETGQSFLPVLAARDDAVRERLEELHPKMATFRPAASDDEGWYLGQLHADQADLAVGERIDRRTA